MMGSRSISVAAICLAGLGLANLWAESPQAGGSGRRELTLLGTLAEWTYPGSERLGKASMSDGGNPLIQSVKCQAVLTTADPVEKVAAFYAEKFETPRAGGPEERKADATTAASVTVQDDSAERPVAVRVVVVNRAETSTTLVISRAEGEEQTHIAWSYYVRLIDDQR